MELIPLKFPKPVPVQKYRLPQKNIPQTRQERDRLRYLTQRYVQEKKPVPPLSMDELREHAQAVVTIAATDHIYLDYTAVLVDNEVWRESLAAIPFERRLLLLPKCLRVEEKCPAPFDEFGLLCKQCGLCTIQDLQAEAERLGYAVLVAEGSAIVMALIETGKIEGIVGVSCLSVLERAFPYMEAAAIPGIALPLLQDDCANTTVDIDWVWDVIHLTSDDRTRRLDLDALRAEVQSWFSPGEISDTLGAAENRTEAIAQEWLARSGKRWRPFLAVCAFQALREDADSRIPQDFRKIAMAVECFHKASLIHDDIEDNDGVRYGEKTLHEEHGVPVALNVGDLLIGEGYRMIAESDASAELKAQMLAVAAAGHRNLCLGQGTELAWVRDPRALSSLEVLDIFRKKTAPAFEVALRLGAIYAGSSEDVWEVLSRYSESLGIAYQIRDDLEDFSEGLAGDLWARRPSLLLSVACERARGEEREVIEKFWHHGDADSFEQIDLILAELKVEERARALLEAYKEETIQSLRDLENASLKGLLRRVVGKIFNELQIKGWCGEFEARNAAGRAAGTAASA